MGFQKVLTAINALASSQNSFFPVGDASSSLQTTCPRALMLDQWIDHSNHTVGTFPQQVQVHTEHYKEGGPIVIYQGAETAVTLCVEKTSIYEFARELGGIAVSIEHRYFGVSVPFGEDKGFSSDGIKYLTLDNIMDDTVNLVNHIRETVKGATESRVIVFGGSYGAQVAAALRLNRPETIFGVVAAAGPFRTYLDDDDNVPGRFDWWNWVSRVISERSVAAASAIRAAFKAFDQAIASDTTDLKAKLNLCREPDGAEDNQHLLQILLQPFSLMVQMNFGGRDLKQPDMEDLIETAIDYSQDPVGLLRAVAEMWYGNSTCISIEPLDILNPGQGIQGYPFGHIICTHMPSCVVSVSPDTIFSPFDPKPSEMFSFCEPTFGVEPFTASQLAEKYHLSQEYYEQTERILYTAGQYDPTSVLGPEPFPLSADVNKPRILHVSNMAHCEDISASHDGERHEVKQAKQIELEIIRGWLQSDK